MPEPCYILALVKPELAAVNPVHSKVCLSADQISTLHPEHQLRKSAQAVLLQDLFGLSIHLHFPDLKRLFEIGAHEPQQDAVAISGRRGFPPSGRRSIVEQVVGGESILFFENAR